ncbi:Tyrosine-specific transport protein [Seminavis robusta]|uniref:Tyrosine-specific transport protein n=1 Tax=Seminavis robusta TaxID=568900 RepID=A0A9N8DED8_9STRA|nr:Tyrosine-specific transport protein [Seminavis robusta]|eukprot:Sro83_g044590.1 Tyrosine-specific transport protein (573) ;mRNA; f:123111-124913
MTSTKYINNSISLSVAVGLLALGTQKEVSALLVTPTLHSQQARRHRGESNSYQRAQTQLMVSQTTDEVTGSRLFEEQEQALTSSEIGTIAGEEETRGMPDLLADLQETIGKVDDDRIIYPELQTGEVPRLYSSLSYERTEEGKVVKAVHAEGSVMGAAALVAGTTIGAGVLALPTATAAAGFVPSTFALGIAWLYMTISGLLIAELTLNRIGSSGRPGLGLLELYENSLGKNVGRIGSAAYFFLHYAIMVAYVAQGGSNIAGYMESLGLGDLASSVPGFGQLAFAGTCGAILYAVNSATVEKINNTLVFGVVASFLAIVGIGSSTADFGALIDPAFQHPEEVVNCFPILFLSLVYQNVVPTVVSQLEGDRNKITTSVIAGTTVPFIMFLMFNGVVLGNALSTGVDLTSGVNPVSLLQSNGDGSVVGDLVSGFSMLAVITSMIGFTYGLLDAWTDVFNIPTEGKEFERWKAPLFGLVFVPPVALSVANPDIFYDALDYAGAFGVSTLFLLLPPFMVWQERYGKEKAPLATKPMVPFGKIPLASMYKAAGTLILEQGAEKLGVFEYLSQHLPSF